MLTEEQIEELRRKLAEKLGEEKLSLEIEQKKDEFYGLINEKAALELVAYEQKLLVPYKKISEIKEGSVVSLKCRVASIGKTTKTKNHCYKDVVVIDETGQITLRVWDKQKLHFKAGDKVIIYNAYLKYGRLNLSRYGSIEVEETHKPKPISKAEGFEVAVVGEYYIVNGKPVLKHNGTQKPLSRELPIKEGTGILLENVIVNGSIKFTKNTRVLKYNM